MTVRSNKGRLLITGGQGMVGRNLLEHPQAGDWDILAPGRKELDLVDPLAVAAYMKNSRPDAVIHAAGLVGGIQANVAQPVQFLTINATIGQNTILGARDAGVLQLINLASTCVYPRDIDGPLVEDMILTGQLEPTNEGYAIAKILALRLCEYIRREDSKFCYKSLIPCNLYGRHDKFDPAHSHLVPAVIHKIHQAAVNGDETVEIWGDGLARREFLYASDLADAVFKALSDIEAIPDLMNIGTGIDYSINEYYTAVAKVVGWHGQFVHDLSKPVGMRRKIADVQRLEEWGWRALTSLEDGLANTYKFYVGRISA